MQFDICFRLDEGMLMEAPSFGSGIKQTAYSVAVGMSVKSLQESSFTLFSRTYPIYQS